MSAGFESVEEVPPVFVLLGDFQSFSCARANPDYRTIRENFKALGLVLSRHTRLKVCLSIRHSKADCLALQIIIKVQNSNSAVIAKEMLHGL